MRTEDNRNSTLQEQDMLHGVTPRVLIIGTIICCLVAVIQVYGPSVAELRPSLNEQSVPSTGGLAMILVLLLINMLINRLNKGKGKSAFKPHEMVLLYVMLSIATMTAGLGFIANTVNSVMGPWYQVLSGRDTRGIWEEYLNNSVSSVIVPQDWDAALGFWMGGADGVPWGLWIMPMITWLVIGFIVVVLLVCIANLVRGYWTEREHLSFPLTAPVLQTFSQTGTGGMVWSNRLALIGIAVAAGIRLVNILNSHFPVIPALTLTVDLGKYFTEPPFNALADYPDVFYLGFEPMSVGIAYLLPINISFSLWFFALAYKALNITMNALGLYNKDAMNTLFWSWSGLARSAGAYVAIALFSFWRARYSIGEMITSAFRGGQKEENAGMSSKGVVFGLLLGIPAICIAMKVFAGVYIYITLAYVLLFLFMSLTFAKMRAEAGIPSNLFSLFETNGFVKTLLGPAAMTEGARGMGFLYNFSFSTSGSYPAWVLEGYKMADEVKLKRKSITFSVFYSFLISAVVAFVVVLVLAYDRGAIMFHQGNIRRAADFNAWRSFDVSFDAFKAGNAKYFFRDMQFVNHILGFAMAVFLSVMNSRFVWWPFHPIGYAIGITTRMPSIWSHFLIAWLVKVLAGRFGGYQTVKKLTPLFIGFVVGSVGVEAIYSVIGLFM